MAWGTDGHRVIASLAYGKLTPGTRMQVDRLLALEPGATLASISTWADENRSPETAAWHYVNFARESCVYNPPRDCPDGQCVLAAIPAQLEILGSRAPDDKRLLALKYVVHLVGDVHQPLHAGHGEDRGGNLYQLQAPAGGTNLHALWDAGLLRLLALSPGRLAAQVKSVPLPPEAADLNPVRAAEESCAIVDAEGFYPGRRLAGAYVERFKPVLEGRLAMAASRLAAMLNRTLP